MPKPQKSTTLLTDQIDPDQLKAITKLIEAGEKAVSELETRRKNLKNKISSIETSIGYKKNFMKRVDTLLDDESRKVAKSVLEQGREMVKVLEVEYGMFTEQIQKISESNTRNNAIIARFKVEKYRETNQLALDRKKGKLAIAMNVQEAGLVIDSKEINRQMKQLTHSVNALIDLRKER